MPEPIISTIFGTLQHIGVEDGWRWGGRKSVFLGKHHAIFGQLIYFWKKEQVPLFFDSILFLK